MDNSISARLPIGVNSRPYRYAASFNKMFLTEQFSSTDNRHGGSSWIVGLTWHSWIGIEVSINRFPVTRGTYFDNRISKMITLRVLHRRIWRRTKDDTKIKELPT